MTWQHDSGELGLAAKFIDQVGRSSPVGVDQRPFDFEHGSVLALPLATEQVVRQGGQGSVQAAFKSGTGELALDGRIGIGKGEFAPMLVSGRRELLPVSSPLRTVRASFPAYGSSF